MNYAVFKIGEKELKLRLDTKNTVALERVMGTNPVNELLKCAGGQMPSFDFISATLHASLQKFEHGYTISKVYDLIDEAIEEGKNLADFIPMLMDVFQVSGLLPKEDKEQDKDPKLTLVKE